MYRLTHPFAHVLTGVWAHILVQSLCLGLGGFTVEGVGVDGEGSGLSRGFAVVRAASVVARRRRGSFMMMMCVYLCVW